MKTIFKEYKINKTGVKFVVSLVALFRAVGEEGALTAGAVPADVLDCLRVGVERPNVTGVTMFKKGHGYVVDGDVLTINAENLTAGYNRVHVYGQYGTNLPEMLIVDVIVPDGAEGGVEVIEDALTLPSASTFAPDGGGADYKTDMYMDGSGRVIVERTDDGGTLVLDEHENPILKRNADGTTVVYDAYQSGRVSVSANGGVTINSGDGEHFVVIGSAVVGATTDTEVGTNALVNGYGCKATGTNSHAEGAATVASGVSSHAEGSSDKTNTCEASGEASHAEGIGCVASGKASHAEGEYTKATGTMCHAEGYSTEASNWASHAEGFNSRASGAQSHAEGSSVASGSYSHAEGTATANGNYSHAEGFLCNANGNYSHAEGAATITPSGKAYCHAQGIFNNPDDAAVGSSFSHGCGTSQDDRRNSFLLAGSEVYVYGVGGYDGTNHAAEGVQSLRQVLSAINLKLVNVPTA